MSRARNGGSAGVLPGTSSSIHARPARLKRASSEGRARGAGARNFAPLAPKRPVAGHAIGAWSAAAVMARLVLRHRHTRTREATMIQANQIKPEMPVVCSKDGALGVVDHMEGADTIKLKKDSKGQHHFIPLSWVKTLDAKVHIDRPGEQAMKEWSDSGPEKGQKNDGHDGQKHDGQKHDGQKHNGAKNGNGKGSPGAAPEMKATLPVPPPSDPAPSSPTKSSTKSTKH